MTYRILSLMIMLMCCASVAAEQAPSSAGREAVAAFAENLMGETSAFLECGQSDIWATVEEMRRRAGFSDADVAAAMTEILEKTSGETNVVRGIIRQGAAMMLGKYGDSGSLPILRTVVLSKDDFAATKAFISYQTLAPHDKILELIGATYGDAGSASYRRVRGVFFWELEKKLKSGRFSEVDRSELVAFLRKHVAVEPDIRDVLEIDSVLSALDTDYTASRERVLNIGLALKKGRPDDAFIMSNVVERLKSARDLVLEVDKKDQK